MPIEIQLEQRSEAWIKSRASAIGSSEVSSILGTNPFKSAYTLWLEKTGRKESDGTNAAMQRGIDYEDIARAILETKVGITFTPKVYRHSDKAFMQVSLDGISEDGKTICEIKCPTSSGLRDYCMRDEVPPYYTSQIDYQLRVSEAERALFFVWYSNEEHYLVEFKRDPIREAEVEKAVTEFWENYILTDTPPPPAEDDYVQIKNETWETLAPKFLSLKAQIKDLEMQLEGTRVELEKVVKKSGHSAIKAAGLKALVITKKGAVNYKAIPELMNVDLELYRKQPSKYIKIT